MFLKVVYFSRAPNPAGLRRFWSKVCNFRVNRHESIFGIRESEWKPDLAVGDKMQRKSAPRLALVGGAFLTTWESISEVRHWIFTQNQKSIEQIPKSGYLDITDSTGSGYGSCFLSTAGHVWRLENCFSSENGAPWSSIASWSAVDHRWKSINIRIIFRKQKSPISIYLGFGRFQTQDFFLCKYCTKTS